MIHLFLEEQRLARRDLALANSIAHEMVEQHFCPDKIADMRDVRRQMTDAALAAAYEAIQRDRALHADEMKLIEAFWKTRLMLVKFPELSDCAPRAGADDEASHAPS